jgi:antitoxin ParD1/3/4
MAGVAKISVALTPELRELVQDAVTGGDYASTSEVVREALRDWKERRERKRVGIAELRRLWDEGIASGPATLLDIEAIKKEGRKRLKADNRRAKE